MRKAVIAALTIGVLLLTGVLRVADLWWARRDTLAAAEARAGSWTLILSEYTAGAFAAADAALRQLALNSRRIGGPSAPEREWLPNLQSARAGLVGIGAISVIDRDGLIRHSTRPEIVGQSRADDYITREALKAAGDDLIVGTPMRGVVAPGGTLIPIARRLTAADGTIEGAVVASFIPSDLRRFYQSITAGGRRMVWVFHPDGTLLFREPSIAIATGESARDNPIFAAASRASEGVLRQAVESGGPVMLSAYRATNSPRLITAVSLDRDEILAEWRREATGSAAIFAAAAALLGATLFVLFRQMDAKAGAERALDEARRLEAEHLRDANDQLAATLAREQRARQEAEAASALKDEFLMTVSHELRTPLTAIAGWARMLVDGMVSDARKQAALESIERNAQTQTRLIEDLLDVSGIMTGKLQLHVRTVHVGDVVEKAVQAVMPAADAKKIGIETSIDPAAGAVPGDPERLQQIMWNLISNAVKFTPAGGQVGVSVTRADNLVQIRVTDTGIGISPGFLPYVFERFRQADTGSTRQHGGLGLGLAIVRSLVELHGGSIAAESGGENQGATFTVRLPAPTRRLS